MSDQNYIYAPTPAINEQFKCKVPMEGSKQLFVVNGKTQDENKALKLVFEEGSISEDVLQIISIRNTPEQFAVILCPRHTTNTQEEDQEEKPLDINNEFIFEKDSSAKLLLCSHTFTKDIFKTNETTTIEVKDGAQADIILMQNEHNRSLHHTKFNINVAKGAKLNMIFLTLHGGDISNDVSVNLNGEHSDVNIDGLYLVDGKQIVSNSVVLTHNVPNCNSSQLFKGILDEEAISKFYGRIIVVPDAQKTEALQANHNLILSDGAKAYTEPQLEIYADDVKCSHGATIGRMNDDELFYMQSRGISKKEAKLLQHLGFTYTVIEKIGNITLRERMFSLVEKRLRGEFSDCKDCSKNCC